jgi:hypothetical protein
MNLRDTVLVRSLRPQFRRVLLHDGPFDEVGVHAPHLHRVGKDNIAEVGFGNDLISLAQAASLTFCAKIRI